MQSIPPLSGPTGSENPNVPAGGPPAPYGTQAWMPPAPAWEISRLAGMSEAQRRARSGGTLVLIAFPLHLLAIAVSMVTLKALVESGVHHSVSWDALFAAAQTAGVMGLLLVGILGQAFFAFVALAGGILLRGNHTAASGVMIAIGVFALLFSFIMFGGIIGAIGGALSAGGGFKALRRSAPTLYYGVPPQYPQPPGNFPP